MKFPLESYRKIYSEFLVRDFPEVEAVIVKKPSLLSGIFSSLKVNVILKPSEEIESMVSCDYLLRNIEKRISELNKYLGQKVVVEINIYFEGELLCHDIWGRSSDTGPM